MIGLLTYSADEGRPTTHRVGGCDGVDDEFEFRSAVRRGVTRACTEDTAVVYVCGRVWVWCGVVEK